MPYKNIGIRIREARLRKRFTQEKLAEMAGISLSFLGHIERGTRKLSVDTLLKLVEVLNCSADDILGTSYLNREMQASAQELLRQAMMLAEKG